MKEQDLVIKCEAGVHVRPAMMLVKKAANYQSEITLLKDGVVADTRSMMSILSLALSSGAKVTVRADGEDEEDALENIVDLIETEFI